VAKTNVFVARDTSVPVTTPWTPETSFCRRDWISPDFVAVKKRSDWRSSPPYIVFRRSNMTAWPIVVTR
jgi:hypothetical protein